MDGQTLSLQAILGYFVVTTMEWLKERRWFPWMAQHTKTVNRIVGAVAATVYSLGIHYQFDSTAGTLVISGLHMEPIRDAVMGYVMQQLIYRGAVEKPREATHMEKKAAAAKTRKMKAKASAALFFALTLGLTACGRNIAPELVATEDAVHDALAKAQDGIDAICQPGVLVEACKEVNGVLVVALKAGRDFNRAVASERIGSLGPLVESAGKVVHAVQKMPAGDLRAKVLADLQRFIDAAFQGVQR